MCNESSVVISSTQFEDWRHCGDKCEWTSRSLQGLGSPGQKKMRPPAKRLAQGRAVRKERARTCPLGL